LLPLAVRTLTDWGRAPGVSSAERLGLDRSVAEVQGATGLLARWQVIGPIAPETAAAIAARPGWLGRPFELPLDDAGRWRALFASGTEGRLRVEGGTGPACLGTTDVALAEASTVQLLASSNGTMRLWAGGRLIHERPKAQAFQPDSDRVEVYLDKGAHRLAVEVSSTSGAPEFHLRFRRKGSNQEHERLAQMALTQSGDVTHGRKVFEDVERSLCLKCHRLGDRGERIGPELSGVGGRFARITIIEAILQPSRSIAPAFETLGVALTDGRVISGVRAAETDDALTLGDAEGRRQTIAKADVESMARQPLSTMPDGLEKRLTAEEFVDLVAYLAAQK
jgi:putative heme-binding domain-containing protein